MNPFLEGRRWRGFHHAWNVAMQALLEPSLGSGYTVDVEERVYVERSEGPPAGRYPDVSVSGSAVGVSEGGLAVAEPGDGVVVAVPVPDEQQELFLTVRDVADDEVITVIETLSPTNKRPGANGRDEYLTKRAELLGTQVNLVEIDLVRHGVRPPVLDPKPDGDYCALVSPGWSRGRSRLWVWDLMDGLPTITVPLRREDGAVSLDLQACFDRVWEEAGYWKKLRYDEPMDPPLPDDVRAGLQQFLLTRGRGEDVSASETSSHEPEHRYDSK